MTTTDPAGARDFDFLFGAWRVRHRKLSRRLAGDTTWSAFDGTVRVRPILGGLGNFDENRLEPAGGGYDACTLRLFDPGSARWSIWWIDGRDPKPEAPVTGRFADGTGTFEGDDVFEGRPIRVRFLWSRITPASARWEQAFSDDGGFAWETNWVMDFTRDQTVPAGDIR